MKARLIIINMALSFAGLSVDTEKTPLWAILILVAWFIASALLMSYAYRKRLFNTIS